MDISLLYTPVTSAQERGLLFSIYAVDGSLLKLRPDEDSTAKPLVPPTEDAAEDDHYITHPTRKCVSLAHLPSQYRTLLTHAIYDSLLTAHCSLLTAHGSRLTAHCSLLTAHCSLLTAHGSRLTAHCLRLSAPGARQAAA